jgi:hypothetical protein
MTRPRRKTKAEITKQKKAAAEVIEELAPTPEATSLEVQGDPAFNAMLAEEAVAPDLSTIKVVRDLQRAWRGWEDEWAEKLMIHYADQNARRSPFTVTLLIPGEPMVIGFDTPEEAQEDTALEDIKYEAERIWKAWQESESYVAAAPVDAARAQEDAERTAAATQVQREMNEKTILKEMGRRMMFVPPGMPTELKINSMKVTVIPGQVCEVPEHFVVIVEEWQKAQEAHAALHGQFTHVGSSGDVGYVNKAVGAPVASSFGRPS